MKKLRWGIVGAGNIANTFAADIIHTENAELVAVAARKLADATAFARKHGIERAYGGYDRLFADEEVDAIYVATPHTFHLPHSVAALEAGKGVLCEKPLTTSAEECRVLIAAAERTGAYLMEAMWTWFLPAIRQARTWFESGCIGELLHVRADFGFPKAYDPGSRLYDPELAGGCLLDMGIYPIAIARLFTDDAPEHVYATARQAPSGVEDDLVMTLEYPGCTAALATSFRCKLPNHAFIIGTKGYVEIPDFWSARESRLIVMHDVVESFSDNRKGSGFEFQIEAVSADILKGKKQSQIVTHAHSLALQQDMARVKTAFSRRMRDQ